MLVPIDPTDPLSHKPLVERESVRILRRRGELIISETKHGFVCANAGIDLSNVEHGLRRAAARGLRPLGPPHPRRPARPAPASTSASSCSDTFGRTWRRGRHRRGHRLRRHRRGRRPARHQRRARPRAAGHRGRGRRRDRGGRRAGHGQVDRHPGRRRARPRPGWFRTGSVARRDRSATPTRTSSASRPVGVHRRSRG